MSETKPALERIADALEDIAEQLEQISCNVSSAVELLDELTGSTVTDARFLRVIDVGRE